MVGGMIVAAAPPGDGRPEEAVVASAFQDAMVTRLVAAGLLARDAGGRAAHVRQETGDRIDLSQVVRDVVELYEPLAEELGVGLGSVASGEFAVDGNRELIAQALSNVVDNAIKYSAGAVESPAVTVSLERLGEEIRLTVADNGLGIPEEADRKRAKERFVRLEKSRSQPGSGLGLSLAQAVMKFHNGRLDLLPGNPGLSVLMTFPGSKDE